MAPKDAIPSLKGKNTRSYEISGCTRSRGLRFSTDHQLLPLALIGHHQAA